MAPKVGVWVLLRRGVQPTPCPLPSCHRRLSLGSPPPKTATADVRALKIETQTRRFINTSLKLAPLPGEQADGEGGQGAAPQLPLGLEANRDPGDAEEPGSFHGRG